jgi:hypothetical protein
MLNKNAVAARKLYLAGGLMAAGNSRLCLASEIMLYFQDFC